METFKSYRRLLVIGVLAGLAGCVPPPPATPGPTVAAPRGTDLLHAKVAAYNAGLAAGKRQQERRDKAALAAAAAQPACPPPMPVPAAVPPRPALLPPPPPPPAVPKPSAPVYTPGGPAVPVGPAQ